MKSTQYDPAEESQITILAVRTALIMAEETQDRTQRAHYIARARETLVEFREKLGNGYGEMHRFVELLNIPIDAAQQRLMR